MEYSNSLCTNTHKKVILIGIILSKIIIKLKSGCWYIQKTAEVFGFVYETGSLFVFIGVGYGGSPGQSC